MSTYWNEPESGHIDYLREKYPVGATIICDYSADTINPLDPGLRGTIVCVDSLGTIHVNWCNGRTLGLIPGEDSFHLEV